MQIAGNDRKCDSKDDVDSLARIGRWNTVGVKVDILNPQICKPKTLVRQLFYRCVKNTAVASIRRNIQFTNSLTPDRMQAMIGTGNSPRLKEEGKFFSGVSVCALKCQGEHTNENSGWISARFNCHESTQRY
jgi:hypothetical protein